jgi:hypothetical protein
MFEPQLTAAEKLTRTSMLSAASRNAQTIGHVRSRFVTMVKLPTSLSQEMKWRVFRRECLVRFRYFVDEEMVKTCRS